MAKDTLEQSITALLTEDSAEIQSKNTKQKLLQGDKSDVSEDFETIDSAPGADEVAGLSKGAKKQTEPQNDPKAKSSSTKVSFSEDDDEDDIEIEFDEEDETQQDEESDDDNLPNLGEEDDEDEAKDKKKEASEESDDDDEDELDEEDSDEKKLNESLRARIRRRIAEENKKDDVSEEDDADASKKKETSEESDDDDKKEVAEEDDDEDNKKKKDAAEESDDDKKEVSEEDDDDFDVDLEDDDEDLSDEDEKKAINEQIKTMFGKVLTEENQAKAAALFETYVDGRVRKIKSRLFENMQSAFTKRAKKFETRMVNNLDKYLDYVVEEWVKSNEITARKSLRHEVCESFITGLVKLFNEHNFDVPETKRNLLDDVVQQAKKTESELSEQVTINAGLKRKLRDLRRQLVVNEATSKLSDIQKQKATKLIESLTYTNANEFAQKVRSVISEHITKPSVQNAKSNVAKKTLSEQVTTTVEVVDGVQKIEESISPEMQSFLGALSRIKPAAVVQPRK